MYASWIDASFWFSDAAISQAERPDVVTCLPSFEKSARPANAMPEFGLFTKPLIDRPGNDTACATPGSASMIASIWRMTSSVRSSVAASGSCA